MLSNRSAFAVIALACVAAAGGGSYLATRHAAESTVAAAPTAPAASSTVAEETHLATAEPANLTPPQPPVEINRVEARQPRQARDTVSRTNTSRATGRPERTMSREVPRVERTSPVGSVAQSDTQTAPVAGAEIPSPETSAPAATSHSADTRPIVPEPPSSNEALEVRFEELVVAADSVVGLVLESTISSDRARVEDTVEARVARDVRVGRRVAIPAGTRAVGSVIAVDRGGKFKDRARLGVRFHTLVLADGSRLPMTTETIYRYGEGPGDSSAKKIGGGAVAGAILGAIIGGAKGAAVGATAGAGGGTAMVMAGERSAATFNAGSEVTARILSPVTVTIDR